MTPEALVARLALGAGIAARSFLVEWAISLTADQAQLVASQVRERVEGAVRRFQTGGAQDELLPGLVVECARIGVEVARAVASASSPRGLAN